MFQSGAKFRREAAMGHEDDSNHRTYLFIGNFVPVRTPGYIGASPAGQCQFCSHRDVPLPRHFGVFMTIEHLTSMKLPVPTRADFLQLQRAESAKITFVERLHHQEWPDN
jgi:hypothetical protein